MFSAFRGSATQAGNLGRREVLRAAAGAAGVVAMATVATACSATAASTSSASPTKGAQKTLIVWRDWYGSTTQTLPLMYEGTQPFRDKFPSIDVKPVLTSQMGGMIPGMIAGDAPDVFQDWNLPGYVTGQLVLDLAPYISRDNVDLTVFPTAEMDFFREVSSFGPKGKGPVYFLPCYIHTQTICVNFQALDDMGQAYPDKAGMPWSAWAQAFRNWTVASTDPKKRRTGGAAEWIGYNDNSFNFITPYYLQAFGGGYVDPADPTKSLLGTTETVNFAREYVGLIRDGVLTLNNDMGAFARGQLVSGIRGTGSGLVQAAVQWKDIKWDFFPPPVFPVHQTAYSATDAYGIWSGTKHPDEAWEFFKWLVIEPDWARFMMKLQLRGPAQRNLWTEWETAVAAVAPPLANKNLGALSAGPINDRVYPGHVFQYSDTAVRNVLNTMSSAVMSGKASVDLALPQAASQIEAIQGVGAQTQIRTTKVQAQFPTTGSPVAAVPAGI